MDIKNKTVSVLIPVYRPDGTFNRLIDLLRKQTYPVSQIIIMNTQAPDFDSSGYVNQDGVEVYQVEKDQFDHGGTRHRGMEYVTGELCICMTQDAVPADQYLVEHLVSAMGQPSDKPVAVVSARQLAAADCGFIERYTRTFNYPAVSSLKTIEDLPVLGIKTYFASNVCSVYDMKIYRESGGFIRKTIFNEDMIYAGRMVQSGYAVAYAADACVIHSHNYTNMQQLRRNFDLAVSQADHPEIFKGIPSESEGLRLVKKTAAYLVKEKKPWLLGELVVKSGFKYLGYRLGKHYERLPEGLIRFLTMNQRYWR